jgi:hypothetical protein
MRNLIGRKVTRITKIRNLEINFHPTHATCVFYIAVQSKEPNKKNQDEGGNCRSRAADASKSDVITPPSMLCSRSKLKISQVSTLSLRGNVRDNMLVVPHCLSEEKLWPLAYIKASSSCPTLLR